MKNTEKYALDTILFLLILLWVYTAASKLFEFEHFKVQMKIQTIPIWLSAPLSYILPPAEILTAVLLLFRQTRLGGLFMSLFLMLVFTGYVGLVLIDVFDHVPCSCGGVLKSMGWKTHFLFNILFLLLTAAGIYLLHRERRVQAHKNQ